jgi:hypothetical protein
MTEWFEGWGNIRQQHSTNLPPAGKAMELDVKDDGIYVKGRIVEPTAKELVKAGVYQAYSVGISRPRIVRDLKAKNGRVVDGITSEISLVDYPANPTCKMALCKRLKGGQLDPTTRYVFSGVEIPADKLNPDIVADAVNLLTKMYATDIGKREFSDAARARMADTGDAMSHGGYPIPDVDALRRAIQAVGRAKDPAATRAHIKQRAKELGRTDLIPDTWKKKKEVMKKGAKTDSPGKKPAPLPAEPGAASVSSNAGDSQVMKQGADNLGDFAHKPNGGGDFEDYQHEPGSKKPSSKKPTSGDDADKVKKLKKKLRKLRKQQKPPMADDQGDQDDGDNGGDDGSDDDGGDDGKDGGGKNGGDKSATPKVKKQKGQGKEKKPKPAAQALTTDVLSDAGSDQQVIKAKKVPCPICNGAGTLNGSDCPKCDGKAAMKRRKILKGFMAADVAGPDMGVRPAKDAAAPLYVRRYHDALCPSVSAKKFEKVYGVSPVDVVKDGDSLVYNALSRAIQADRGTGKYFQIITSLTDAYGCAKSLATLQPSLLKQCLTGQWGNTGSNAPGGIPDPKSATDSVNAGSYGRMGNTSGQERRSPADSRSSGDSGARMPSAGNAIAPEQFGRMDYVSGEQRRSPGDRVTKRAKRLQKGYGVPVTGDAAGVFSNAAANQAQNALQSLHDHLSWTWPDMCPLGHPMSNDSVTNNRQTGKTGYGRIDMKDMSVPQPVSNGRVTGAQSNAGVPGRLVKVAGASNGAPALKKMTQLRTRTRKLEKSNAKLKKRLNKMAGGPDTRRAPIRGAMWDPMAILKGKQPEQNGDGRKRDLKAYLETLANAGSAALSPEAASMLTELD